jgi:hypothetical protein
LKERKMVKYECNALLMCTRLYLSTAVDVFVGQRLCDARIRAKLSKIFKFFRKRLHTQAGILVWVLERKNLLAMNISL